MPGVAGPRCRPAAATAADRTGACAGVTAGHARGVASPPAVIERLLVGSIAATVVAHTAWRAGALTRSGAAAAVLTGAAATAAGLGWALVLVGFFVVGTGLSRAGRAAKARRTAAVVDKPGARDARQVFANGGVFAATALGAALWELPLLAVAALGALAGALADTAATEIGTWVGGRPRSIISGALVAPGISGGVTAVGSAAGIAAAALLAAIAAPALLPAPALVAVWVGGVVGLFADSLFGATLQERRWCTSCAAPTERRTHGCGDRSRVVGGIPGMDNDWVNAAATSTAGLAAALAWSLGQPA
jgi:uncharacterized protein (TIGR00297 family)